MSNDHERLKMTRLQGLRPEQSANSPQRLNAVRDLFNRSAPFYDQVNEVFSLRSGAWYRRFCLRRAGLRPGAQVVDIGVGTGLLAREALSLTGDPRSVIGIDISEAMLAIAHKNLGIPLVQCAAEALPLKPAIADFVTMGYALRHVADLEVVLREACRILQPGGRIVLLEVGAPRFWINRMLATAYVGGLLPLLSLLLTRKRGARTLMRYHWDTIANIMPREAIVRVMTESGFSRVKCESYFDLFQCYVGDKPSAAQPNA